MHIHVRIPPSNASAHTLHMAGIMADGVRVRLESLKGSEAFAAVFKHGTRFAYRGITAFVVFRAPERQNAGSADAPTTNSAEQIHAMGVPVTLHFGVTAKKRTRPAVLRNRIKRLLRESLRHSIRRLLEHSQHLEGFACIERLVLVCNIIPERPTMLRLQALAPLVERILKQALAHVAQQHAPTPTQQQQ